MNAYTAFKHSVASTKSLTDMYSELRKRRGLGPRGRLPPGHEDLLWLPRSAVVTAIASLDAYVHAVLRDRVPQVLRCNSIPTALCNSMADLVPIKDGNTFRSAFRVLSSGNIHDDLARSLQDSVLAFNSYQMPEKIIHAYAMIGYQHIFACVSRIWPGPSTSEADIKRLLAKYVRRRNQIAHEGDRDAGGAIIHMQPKYAKDCAKFIEDLVSRLNRIVYESSGTTDVNS